MIFHAIILVIINILQDLNYFIHIIENVFFIYMIYGLTGNLQNRIYNKFVYIFQAKASLYSYHILF